MEITVGELAERIADSAAFYVSKAMRAEAEKRRQPFAKAPRDSAREASSKIQTSEGATAFAKLVSSREIESPLSKSEWVALIQFQADANGDPKLSKQQRFSKYLDTPIGRELYFACQVAPGLEVEVDKATSTPMAVVSGYSDRAFLSTAMNLESGRAAREAAAMRPDITPRVGDAGADDETAPGAEQEARARAARRHAMNGSRSFERQAPVTSGGGGRHLLAPPQ
jgi:hypothetical protein